MPPTWIPGVGVAGRGSVMCGWQLGWEMTRQRWFQCLQGGVSHRVTAATSSSPRRGVGAATSVWGQWSWVAVGLRSKGLGHQASRGERLARRGC